MSCSHQSRTLFPTLFEPKGHFTCLMTRGSNGNILLKLSLVCLAKIT